MNNRTTRRNNKTKARHRTFLQVIKVSVYLSKRSKKKSHIKQLEDRALDNAICFSLRNSWKYDHSKVKLLVETQIKCQVKSIEFDPLSKRSSNPHYLDRWIVCLPSREHCDQALERGLAADGCRVVVRYWNDIVIEECGKRV